MLIEILYFDDCPNYRDARALVDRVSDDLDVLPEIRMIGIPDPERADRLRFLGSPTIRVNGRDIEPGADTRDQFTLACRVYGTDSGLQGLPAESWLREALATETSGSP